MKQTFILSLLIIAGLTIYSSMNDSTASDSAVELVSSEPNRSQAKQHTAIFAGGCFWCIEADFEKLDGVSKVVSGYTGGAAETANYKTVSYTETGHFEAVRVHYDASVVSYSELLVYFWRNIDPTNDQGQFCDSGSSYLSGIFYGNDAEQKIVTESLASLQRSKPFAGDIVTYIGPAKPFYLAEEYHQDYYKKNPIRYKYYRNGCGRDKRLKQLWGK